MPRHVVSFPQGDVCVDGSRNPSRAGHEAYSEHGNDSDALSFGTIDAPDHGYGEKEAKEISEDIEDTAG